MLLIVCESFTYVKDLPAMLILQNLHFLTAYQ